MENISACKVVRQEVGRVGRLRDPPQTSAAIIYNGVRGRQETLPALLNAPCAEFVARITRLKGQRLTIVELLGGSCLLLGIRF